MKRSRATNTTRRPRLPTDGPDDDGPPRSTSPRSLYETDIQREERGVQCTSIADRDQLAYDLRSMRLLAKEIVASRRTVARLHENKAQMNSVSMMLTEQLATVRSVGHLEKSTEVLSAMNGLVRNADVRDSMREMSKEMAKSGLIEELVNDALEDINGVDDLEAETDAEVNKILAELAGETAVAMRRPRRGRVEQNRPPSPNRVCAPRRNERRPSTICRRDWTPYARWRKPAENVLIKTSPSTNAITIVPRIVSACEKKKVRRRRWLRRRQNLPPHHLSAGGKEQRPPPPPPPRRAPAHGELARTRSSGGRIPSADAPRRIGAFAASQPEPRGAPRGHAASAATAGPPGRASPAARLRAAMFLSRLDRDDRLSARGGEFRARRAAAA